MKVLRDLANMFTKTICPRCGYVCEKRVKEPKGCPACRFIFWNHKEKVPEGYEMNLTYGDYLAGTQHWYDPREEVPWYRQPKVYTPPVYDFTDDSQSPGDRVLEVVVNGELISYQG
jgi:hypothetical protein